MLMKSLYCFTVMFLMLISCSNQENESSSEKLKEFTQPILDSSSHINITEGLTDSRLSNTEESKPMFINVELHDTSRKRLIREIISKNLHTLSANNLLFLDALQYENKSDWIFNRPLSPVYQFEKNKTGVVSQVYDEYYYQHKDVPISKEFNYLEKIRPIEIDSFTETDYAVYYPHLLGSIKDEMQKPLLYSYSTSEMDSSQISNFGIFIGHCVNYFHYTLDTTKINFQDSVLFASSFRLDLEFKNYPKIDSTIIGYNKANYYSFGPIKGLFPFKTFARFKNIENLYFIYYDTFPLNTEFEPRALVYIDNTKVHYLWYHEDVLHGCI